MYCPYCGCRIDSYASFCPNCGAALGYNNTYGMRPQKSRLAAGLFGILLGGLGIHSFYLGHVGKGIAQILLSFCFGIGAIWGLIEGILILVGVINTDADGVPLRD